MSTYLGQNFLKDVKIREFIANKIKKTYIETGSDFLIEIGPGKGSITKLIKDISDNFFVIEKDQNMLEYLINTIDSKKILFGDILDLDLSSFFKKHKKQKIFVVGNLPYYITSPILRKFFGYGKQEFTGGLFMVQNEVAQRIQTSANKKSYLWRLLNHSYDVVYLKQVSAKSFSPPPKVKSAIFTILPKTIQTKVDFNKLLNFLELVSPYSRKTLGKIDKMIQKKLDKNIKIPTNLQNKRLEECSWLDLEQFLNTK